MPRSSLYAIHSDFPRAYTQLISDSLLHALWRVLSDVVLDDATRERRAPEPGASCEPKERILVRSGQTKRHRASRRRSPAARVQLLGRGRSRASHVLHFVLRRPRAQGPAQPKEVRRSSLGLRAAGAGRSARHELRQLATADPQHTTRMLCGQPTATDPRSDRTRCDVRHSCSLGDGEKPVVTAERWPGIATHRGRQLVAQHLAHGLPDELPQRIIDDGRSFGAHGCPPLRGIWIR